MGIHDLCFYNCVISAEESGVASLIDLFYKQEELARAEEQKTDAILDGKKDSEQTERVSSTSKSQEEFIEETVTKCLYNIYLYVHVYVSILSNFAQNLLIIMHRIVIA